MQAPVPSGTLRLVSFNPTYNKNNEIIAFNEAPLYLPDSKIWMLQMAYVLNGVMKGKTNNTGRVTLTASSATTTVSLRKGLIGRDTLVILSPLTANAATEFGAGSIYISDVDVANSQFTITHVNSATTGRKFGYILIG